MNGASKLTEQISITYSENGKEKICHRNIAYIDEEKQQRAGIWKGYDNDILVFTCPYENGKVNGTVHYYNRLGHLIQSIPFVDDKKHGRELIWHTARGKDAEKPIEVNIYDNDNLTSKGVRTGNVVEIMTFRDNKLQYIFQRKLTDEPI
jgi:antitoxin component YwqK of YwqJK toxin-antitoxin module